MFLTLGVKAGTIRQSQMWAVAANLVRQPLGSKLVALMYYYGGGSLLPVDSLVHSAALAKPPRRPRCCSLALCNWLVCLAIWMAIRAEGAAKFIAIWWCLLAFIAPGYEHLSPT